MNVFSGGVNRVTSMQFAAIRSVASGEPLPGVSPCAIYHRLYRAARKAGYVRPIARGRPRTERLGDRPVTCHGR